jgi:hypothetical protein
MRISPILDLGEKDHLYLTSSSTEYESALASCKMFALGMIQGQEQFRSNGFTLTSTAEDFKI